MDDMEGEEGDSGGRQADDISIYDAIGNHFPDT